MFSMDSTALPSAMADDMASITASSSRPAPLLTVLSLSYLSNRERLRTLVSVVASIPPPRMLHTARTIAYISAYTAPRHPCLSPPPTSPSYRQDNAGQHWKACQRPTWPHWNGTGHSGHVPISYHQKVSGARSCYLGDVAQAKRDLHQSGSERRWSPAAGGDSALADQQATPFAVSGSKARPAS